MPPPGTNSPLPGFAKNFGLAALAVVAGGLAFYAWLQHEEIGALREQIDAIKAEGRAHSGRKNSRVPLDNEDGADTSTVAMDDGTGAGGKKKHKKDELADGTQKPKAKDTVGWRAYAALAGNPEFEKLSAAQARAQAGRTYGMLFKSLNLTPESQSHLQDLLAQRQQAVTDAVVATRENHIKSKTAPAEFAADLSQATGPVDAQIRAMLGDASFGQFQQYQDSIPVRNLVGQLQLQLQTSAAPLADDQATRLVQLLAEAKAAESGTGASYTGPGTRSLLAGGGVAKVTDQTIAIAQQVLTAPQLQALQQIQLERAQQSELDKLMKGKPVTSGTAKPPGKK